MNQSKQLVQLIEIAIMTAIALILDMVSGMFLKMPQGG
ncbi:energy-coupled thiamine transporter ThiT, partial [Bacillus haynesii]|nr:energy-coupled thiamine transporter ThiT [Bacillus haynesii]